MNSTSLDHYEVLGVSRDASSDEIERAYRKLAHATHPDKGGNAALFRIIHEARETLVDSRRRQDYDETAGPVDKASAEDASEQAGHTAWEPKQGDASGAPTKARWWDRMDNASRWTIYSVLGINTFSLVAMLDGNLPLIASALGALVIVMREGRGWSWWTRILVGVAASIGLLIGGFLLWFVLAVLLVLAAFALVFALMFPQGARFGWAKGLQWLIGRRPVPGEIWYADFPFEENEAESKDRPCLVITHDGDDYLTCKITSVDHSDRRGYHPVTPAVTGLPKLSFIRVSPTVRLSRKQFRRCVGTADPALWAWAVQKNTEAPA